jgi:hypothetical protein
VKQQYLPVYQDNSPTHSELQKQCSERLRLEGPGMVDKIGIMLLEADRVQNQLYKAQRVLHEVNSVALLLSALDPRWVVFSDAAFEQVILPSKTSVSSAIKTLTTLYKEQTQNANS